MSTETSNRMNAARLDEWMARWRLDWRNLSKHLHIHYNTIRRWRTDPPPYLWTLLCGVESELYARGELPDPSRYDLVLTPHHEVEERVKVVRTGENSVEIVFQPSPFLVQVFLIDDEAANTIKDQLNEVMS